MDFGIRNKVALVAASSQGLGRAVADDLAAEGVKLVVCSRRADAIEAAAAELRETHGADVLAVAGDLTNPADIDRVVAAANDTFGGVDILVTNTGGPPAGTFDTLSVDDWDLAVRQNLNSVLNLVRAVLPGMKEKGWGRIVNVTSISVKQPVDNLMLSNAVRAGVTGFAKTLSNEIAKDGITVNCVLPGYTRTQRVEQLARAIAEQQGVSVEEGTAGWEAQIPMGRIGEPREFGAMVAFLCSERASYITGVSIPVDGGWTKGLL